MKSLKYASNVDGNFARLISSLWKPNILSQFRTRPNFYFLRNFSFFNPSYEVEVEEQTIEVPWGHISAKLWNPQREGTKKSPVIAIHGWKDNCGTWDTLMPLLVRGAPSYEYLAIDLPGHGRSSHFPLGMIYSMQDLWLLIQRIINNYQWNQVTLLGHSMGAQVAFMYAGTHPQYVKKLVAIDALSPIVLGQHESLSTIPKLTSDMLKFERKIIYKPRPEYTYEEIVEKLLKTHTGGLDRKACEILMTRGVEETYAGSNKYSFSHDIRVHYLPITGITSKQVSAIAKQFQSDVLFIKAKHGVNYTRSFIKNKMEDWLSSNKNNIVRFVEIDGSHHIQLVDPEALMPFIMPFLNRDHDLELINARYSRDRRHFITEDTNF